MTEAFVVDASVGCAWVYPSQAPAETDALLERVEAGATVVAPALWFLEVANGLLAAQRRKLLTGSERRLALQMLSALRVTIDDVSGHVAFHQTSALAENYGLSRDRALRGAAQRSGVNMR